MGIKKVYIPKVRLFHLFFLKSPKSISSPAKNIIYSNPAVPERMILLSLNTRLNPLGPITAPAIINPNKWGILNLFSNNGAANIIIRINKNFNTGSVNGKVILASIIGIIYILYNHIFPYSSICAKKSVGYVISTSVMFPSFSTNLYSGFTKPAYGATFNFR